MQAETEGKRRSGRQKMRWLDSRTKFEHTLQDRGQGSLACCSPWGHKESDMTEQLNNNNNNKMCLWQGGKGFFIMRSTFENIYADCLKKKEKKRYYSGRQPCGSGKSQSRSRKTSMKAVKVH